MSGGPVVLISENLASEMPDLLTRYPEARFVHVPLHGEEMRPEYLEAEVLFRSAMSDELFDAILEGAENLRWVQISAAGFDWMGGPKLERRVAEGLQITRSRTSYSDGIAEYVITAIMMAARGVGELMAAQERREWIRSTGREIAASRVLVLGTGAIGSAVAWRAAALGASVVGVSRSGSVAEHFERVVTTAQLDTELADADYVVLAMPLTPETQGLLGAERFALMPDHAVVVNVGRGALVDEAAMQDALNAGTIAGAVVDAFVEEPLPPESPWWTTANTIVTPHSSFRTTGMMSRLCADFCENFDLYLDDQPLVGTKKEPALGY
ncbi:D-2-hydroxyacid dehydrogenase [Litorihabitans aurantiacus]|uniref:Hydroxyacid dehydrogenase n=1 Tax=Litorihabitans aurantiacus TaxID=1930061 RepID=A0AA37XCN5_9MICO|nr:D-2-hydroxyacid dehydrogenase [Litorihabitans aurantiacus]GMA30406.1 hydroxyacid dehydrogenase [Litorihabitans aurantiacus]